MIKFSVFLTYLATSYTSNMNMPIWCQVKPFRKIQYNRIQQNIDFIKIIKLHTEELLKYTIAAFKENSFDQFI